MWRDVHYLGNFPSLFLAKCCDFMIHNRRLAAQKLTPRDDRRQQTGFWIWINDHFVFCIANVFRVDFEEKRFKCQVEKQEHLPCCIAMSCSLLSLWSLSQVHEIHCSQGRRLHKKRFSLTCRHFAFIVFRPQETFWISSAICYPALLSYPQPKEKRSPPFLLSSACFRCSWIAGIFHWHVNLLQGFHEWCLIAMKNRYIDKQHSRRTLGHA